MTLPDDSLHASKQSIEKLLTPEYWRQICPHLHVDDAGFQASFLAQTGQLQRTASAEACKEIRRRLVDEGFAALTPADLRWSVDVSLLADGVLALERSGWPATFIAVYDEAWVMGHDASSLMAEATGNCLCMDIVGFLVDPRRATGFSPHRDRQPEDWMPRGVPESVAGTFKEDGMAKYVTLWAALTDAHPDNSCLHFVPRSSDPGYIEGDTEDSDPMKLCFGEKAAYQTIRSAPVAAGGCTFHTHRTIHWGNTGRPSYIGAPRIALSFGCSTADFEPPYFNQKSLPFPQFDLRVALTAAQVINYATLSGGDAGGWVALAGSMAQLTSGTLTTLHRLFQRRIKAFHPSYRKEIAKKYVRVSLNAPRGSSPVEDFSENVASTPGQSISAADASKPKAPKKRRSRGTKNEARAREFVATASADDDEDDALEAMLEAEATCGEVLFHDDFDMLNGCESEDAGGDVGRKGRAKKNAASSAACVRRGANKKRRRGR